LNLTSLYPGVKDGNKRWKTTTGQSWFFKKFAGN